jgi:hypothetical protein
MTSSVPVSAPVSSPVSSAVSAPLAVLLGAQRFDPTLGSAVSQHGIHGRFAMITAGWQEREPEDEELRAHLGGDAVNLRLHARGGELFKADPELAAAHRERQRLLRHLQEIYRIRLDHALDAESEVNRYDMPARMRDEMRTTSIEAIKSLDAWHLEKCQSVRDEFEARWKVLERDEVARHREEIKAELKDCVAVAIAGGHVAVLINRLMLFGLRSLIGDRHVFAWSAGAMAITDRIVLFHDDPPQGHIARQVLDVGLGIVPRTVVFPTPERRLNLEATDRVALLSRRFAPATCLVLPDRSYVTWTGSSYGNTSGVVRLGDGGESIPFAPLRAHA